MPYTYTSKGYKFVEYDPDPPEPRSHCIQCEAKLPDDFASRKPSRPLVRHHFVEEWVDGHPTRREATPEEIERGEAEFVDHGPWWDCPVCGYGHEPEDLFS